MLCRYATLTNKMSKIIQHQNDWAYNLIKEAFAPNIPQNR